MYISRGNKSEQKIFINKKIKILYPGPLQSKNKQVIKKIIIMIIKIVDFVFYR